MPRYDLVVLGDANPDVVVSGAPERLTFGQAERTLSRATLTLGGSGALVAHAAARLGLRTAFVGLVGDDRAGDIAVGALSEAGVDVSAVRREPGLPTAVTLVFTRPDGDRAILTAPGSLSAFSPEHVDRAVLADAGHVHVTSLFLQPLLAPALPELLTQARAAGAVTSLDTNDDPTGRWSLDRDGLLPAVDYLLPNEREVVALASGAAARADTLVDMTRTLDAARSLAAHGPRVVVTCGAAGAVAVDGDRVLRVLLDPPSAPVADTVGAGDAFAAGIAWGIAQGLDLADTLRLAAAAGQLSTRLAGGADGQPDAAETVRLAERARVETVE